eukprot:jgi/Mesen1/8498/ME000480S07852
MAALTGGGGFTGPPIAFIIAFACFLVTACLFWPVGIIMWICNRLQGNRIISIPATSIYPSIYNCFPI